MGIIDIADGNVSCVYSHHRVWCGEFRVMYIYLIDTIFSGQSPDRDEVNNQLPVGFVEKKS